LESVLISYSCTLYDNNNIAWRPHDPIPKSWGRKPKIPRIDAYDYLQVFLEYVWGEMLLLFSSLNILQCRRPVS